MMKSTGKQIYSCLVLLIAVIAGPAAFAQKVNVEFDQSADSTQYKTFTIRKGQLNSQDPALNSELVQKQIEGDISRGLTARGLTARGLTARGLTEVPDNPI